MFGLNGFIGFYAGSFVNDFSAVTTCCDINCDFSLAAGRDLPRVRDSSAPSPGSDIQNFKHFRPAVLNNEVVLNVSPFYNRGKFKEFVGKDSFWSGG